MFFHLPLQFAAVVLHAVETFAEGLATNDFFDVITAGLVGVEEHVDFIHAPEEIMQIAHDILIRTHQKEPQKIRLISAPVFAQLMQWK